MGVVTDGASRIDARLAAARARLDRVRPESLDAEVRAGALVVDLRPDAFRAEEGEIPGSIAIERIHLEWRLDHTSGAALPDVGDDTRYGERKVLLEAANEARVEQRKVSREMETKALEQVRKNGVTVTEISAQERARMREKVKPVTDKYVKEIGEDVVKTVYAEIDRVRVK